MRRVRGARGRRPAGSHHRPPRVVPSRAAQLAAARAPLSSPDERDARHARPVVATVLTRQGRQAQMQAPMQQQQFTEHGGYRRGDQGPLSHTTGLSPRSGHSHVTLPKGTALYAGGPTYPYTDATRATHILKALRLTEPCLYWYDESTRGKRIGEARYFARRGRATAAARKASRLGDSVATQPGLVSSHSSSTLSSSAPHAHARASESGHSGEPARATVCTLHRARAHALSAAARAGVGECASTHRVGQS